MRVTRHITGNFIKYFKLILQILFLKFTQEFHRANYQG